MKSFIKSGINLAKNFFQVHAIEREGAPAVARKLSRGKVLGFFAQAAPCRVGMRSCGSSHYWAREIQALGHEVGLDSSRFYTKPYVKRGKNDANDAAAICEAMSRPDMRFVPIKSADQQAVLMLHKTRELLVKQRTMTVNALRGHLLGVRLDRAQGHPAGYGIAGARARRRDPSRSGQASIGDAGLAQRRPRRKDRRFGEDNRPSKRQQPNKPVAGRDPRLRPADRIGDRRSHSRSQGLQVGKRFQRVSGPYAEPALERR